LAAPTGDWMSLKRRRKTSRTPTRTTSTCRLVDKTRKLRSRPALSSLAGTCAEACWLSSRPACATRCQNFLWWSNDGCGHQSPARSLSWRWLNAFFRCRSDDAEQFDAAQMEECCSNPRRLSCGKIDCFPTVLL
jgi:hypothetical protein